eukprot:TRINITY_DN8354_c0_g1_i1.p1 TRINITY_DN8354_c0_g1~~TRINITY_DN8354_c0_g1_i1.p1  ORF type:complete len:390 (-),score=51.96 TRINITY_DN8354_c0_g1_i1:69-1238(-)
MINFYPWAATFVRVHMCGYVWGACVHVCIFAHVWVLCVGCCGRVCVVALTWGRASGADSVFSTMNALLASLPFIDAKPLAEFSHPGSCGCVRRPEVELWRPYAEQIQRPPVCSVPNDQWPGLRHLPDELLMLIFDYLTDVRSFVAIGRVCHRWRTLCWHDVRCFPDVDPLTWRIHPTLLLKQLERRSAKLQQLFLPRAGVLDFQSFCTAKFAQSIRSLSLHGLVSVPSWTWVPPLVSCLSLCFNGADLSRGFSVSEFCRLPNLRWLDLSFFHCGGNFRGSNGLVERLEQLPSLRKLALTTPRQFMEALPSCDLSRLSTLHELHLCFDAPFSTASPVRRLLVTGLQSGDVLSSVVGLVSMRCVFNCRAGSIVLPSIVRLVCVRDMSTGKP